MKVLQKIEILIFAIVVTALLIVSSCQSDSSDSPETVEATPTVAPDPPVTATSDSATSESTTVEPTQAVTELLPSTADPDTVETTPTPLTLDGDANASVSGTITYEEDIELTSGATVQVQLRDTSLQDVASVLIAEQVITNPGQVPIDFEVQYDRDVIESGNTYSLVVKIIESDGRWVFWNDTAYDVITRGKPDRVNMLVVPT